MHLPVNFFLTYLSQLSQTFHPVSRGAHKRVRRPSADNLDSPMRGQNRGGSLEAQAACVSSSTSREESLAQRIILLRNRRREGVLPKRRNRLVRRAELHESLSLRGIPGHNGDWGNSFSEDLFCVSRPRGGGQHGWISEQFRLLT